MDTLSLHGLRAIERNAMAIAQAARDARILRGVGMLGQDETAIARSLLEDLAGDFGCWVRPLPPAHTNSLPSERALSADDRADRGHQSAREERL